MRKQLQPPIKARFKRRDYKGYLLITFEVKQPTTGRHWSTLKPVSSYTASFTGEIHYYNNADNDSYGQVYDDVNPREYYQTKELRYLLKAWRDWHLNDMKAGTLKQTKLLNKHREIGSALHDYTADCEYLKSIGAYEDRGYKYGTAWLIKPIPFTKIREISKVMREGL